MKKVLLVVALAVLFTVAYALAGVGYKDYTLKKELAKNLQESGKYTDEEIVDILGLPQFGEDLNWESWKMVSGQKVLTSPGASRAAIVHVNADCCIKLVKVLYDRSAKEKQ